MSPAAQHEITHLGRKWHKIVIKYNTRAIEAERDYIAAVFAFRFLLSLDYLRKVIAVLCAQDAPGLAVLPEKALTAGFRLIREVMNAVDHDCLSSCFVSHLDNPPCICPVPGYPGDDKSPAVIFDTAGLCPDV